MTQQCFDDMTDEDIANELWDIARWQGEVELSRIQKLMEAHLHFAKKYRKDHPVLHEACQQPYRGATLILWVAWNSPEWRKLFYDKEYRDRYGGAPITRIGKNRVELGQKHTLEGDPDLTKLIEDILSSDSEKHKVKRDKSPQRGWKLVL